MSDVSEKKIVVNEKEVTKEELEEMKKDKNIRLHEEAPDKFRILHKLVE
jgi:hypothetical protein